MDELFKKLNIKPKQKELYTTAFSHSSYVNEHKVKNDYERLEFLGDAVLDLVVADYLYTHYKEDEGEMTKVRANYVCENANYNYATYLGLQQYILVGHGELKDGAPLKKAIVGGFFPSIADIEKSYFLSKTVKNLSFDEEEHKTIKENLKSNPRYIIYCLDDYKDDKDFIKAKIFEEPEIIELLLILSK